MNKEVSANSRPKMTSVEMVDKSPTVGNNVTLKMSSKGCSSVQYSVYLYSPTKKVWENVSNGYTTAVAGNGTYSIKLRKPLHKGENNLSVWVKKSYASPINKGGYDDFKSFSVNVNDSNSQALPSIKSASIASSEQKAGVYPNMKLSSNSDGKVQYSVYLYSPLKKIWEDVSGGYSAPIDASTTMNLKLNKPLHNGINSFSIWVKRAGQPPTDKGGYDNFLSYKVNATGTSSNILPNIKSASITSSEQRIGVKPTINITATGSEKVQYSAYIYSKTKKVWEDAGNGYTSPQDPTISYKFQSKIPLDEGINSFSIWVKREGMPPTDKGGYDNFFSYQVNVKSQSTIIPKITSLNVEESQVNLGGMPSITLRSNSDVDVQYSVYLHSQSKGIWENVSGGYSNAVNPNNSTSIKIKEPLKPGKNTLSVWVKRAGYAPSDPSGYDSYVHEVVDVSINLDKTPKISSVSFNEEYTFVGSKAEITCLAKSGDGSNISYKTFLYSNSKKQWIESSTFTDSRPGGEAVTIKLDKSLEEGTNRILVWSKRAWVSGEVYEDYKTIEINAKRPGPLKKRIIIDPGHGGKDSGAVSLSGTKERDIALSVSSMLGNTLRLKGYDILYTRQDNNNVNWDSSNQSASLKYRSNFANSNGADLFVSIHCNSNSGTPASGTETYYSSKNPNKDKALATSIQQELVKAIGLRDRGAKLGNFWVVNNTQMPASLVELAFINNLSEEQKLKDPSFQQKAANGIANGIVKYVNN
ncbi:MAG: N-acetylmuramoyl-L-alanine amidase [Clostridium sp.]